MIGIPGKSNAFAISRKLGLDEHIIEGAADQIDESVKDFETILADLERVNRRLKKNRKRSLNTVRKSKLSVRV